MSSDRGSSSANIDRVAKYVHDQKRNFEWFWYSHSYLSAAKCLADEYKAQKKFGEHIFAPLIYNLRHGLELLLKLLALATGSAISDVSHHDIHRLFAKVKQALARLDNESIAFAAEGLGVEESLISKYLEIMTERVEGITRKYHLYEFLSNGAQPIEDPKNQMFRYPSSTVSAGAFDLAACSKKLPAAEVLDDIDMLHNFLLSVVVLFGKRDGTHMLKGLDNQGAENGQHKDA